MKIRIDPGHGGVDSGAVGHGYKEKDIVLEAALYIGGRLQSLGAEVSYTRTTDTFAGQVEDRGKSAKGCDYFLSIHCNGGSAAATGAEVWCSGGELYAGTESRYAENLGKLLTWRGVKSRNLVTDETVMRPYDGQRRFKDLYSFSDWYGVLRGCESVGVSGDLLEMFFITNKADLDCYLEHKQDFWEAVVKAVCDTYHLAYAPPESNEPEVQTVPRAEYDALTNRYEELWNKYGALADGVKTLAKGL